MKGSPYIQGYFILNEGVPVGYALVCPTYSNEAGGMLITLDELFILPAFRGRGLGSGFMRYYENRYAQGLSLIHISLPQRKFTFLQLLGQLVERSCKQEIFFHQVLIGRLVFRLGLEGFVQADNFQRRLGY